MKTKLPVVILVILCLGLLAGLIVRHNNAVRLKRADDERIRYLSNQWARTTADLNDQLQRAAALTNQLDTTQSDLRRATEELTQTRQTLEKTEAAVVEATKAIKTAEEEIAKRDARIAELENQNTELDKQAADMKTAIGNLETQIAATEKQLAAAKGDRDFLLKELHRLQTEKAELVRRLNDVVALREQINKIREELSLARRLDLLRRTLYGAEPRKGGELLQQGVRTARPTNAADLNVEIRRDGSATVVPPQPTPPPENK